MLWYAETVNEESLTAEHIPQMLPEEEDHQSHQLTEDQPPNCFRQKFHPRENSQKTTGNKGHQSWCPAVEENQQAKVLHPTLDVAWGTRICIYIYIHTYENT